MKLSFWPLLIGILLLIFGAVGVANEVFKMRIYVPWWPIVVLIIGMWILSHAFKRI